MLAVFLACRSLQLWMSQREWFRSWKGLQSTAGTMAILLTIVGVLDLSSEAWRYINQKLYEEFREDERVAFALVAREDPETVKTFVQQEGYAFPTYAKADEETPRLLQSGDIHFAVILK